MQRQIIVPLDGSELAEKALPHAVALARITGSGLTLLQVVPLPQMPNPLAWGAPVISTPEGYTEEMLAGAREYLQSVAGHLGSENIPTQTHVAQGDAAEGIVIYAEQHPETAMIVLANHGRGGLSRWLLGSVAEKVLEAAPVPLALIHPAAVEVQEPDVVPSYRTVLVPLDTSALAEEALEHARAIAGPAGATMLLVSVMPLPDHIHLPIPPKPAPAEELSGTGAQPYLPPRESVAQVLQDLHDREIQALDDYLHTVADRVEGSGTPRVEVNIRILEGDTAKEILRAGREGGADLIVMSTRGRGGLARLWPGSVAMKVAREAALPVLLVPAQLSEQPPG